MANKQYTNAELIEIGRKALERQQKANESARKRAEVKSNLYKAFKEGKITLPS